MTIVEKKQRRAQLVKDARKLLDTAETEERDLTAEQIEQYEKMMTDVDKIGAEIEKEERVAALESEMREVEERAVETQTREPEKREDPEKRKMDAFNRFLRGGLRSLNETEARAMQVDDDEGGGYIVAPMKFIWDLLQNVDDLNVVRQFATKHQVTDAVALGVPYLATDASDADWTIELDIGDETEVKFGRRELRPHPLAKYVKISNTLIRKNALSVEQIVRERLAYKFAVAEEKAFMEGDGNQKPLGLFTASDDGIDTGQDISTGNTTSEIKADNLIECKYTLKQPYWRNARWIFHRDAIKMIRKMKDGEGQYLWQPGLVGGQPDRILGFPVTVAENAPKTFSTGEYVGLLGDLTKYWIADALSMQIQRLVELYAATNQVGYIGRMECDGMPVLAEAFVRVTLG